MPRAPWQLRTNAGKIHGSDGAQLGVALSTALATLNHDCDPNAAAAVCPNKPTN